MQLSNNLLWNACCLGYKRWTVQLIGTIIEAGADPHYKNDIAFIESCARDGEDGDFTIPAYFLNEHNIDLNHNGCGVDAFRSAMGTLNFDYGQKLLDCGLILSEDSIKKIIRGFDSGTDFERLIELLIKNGFNVEFVMVECLQLCYSSEFYSNDPFLNLYKNLKKYESEVNIGEVLMKTLDRRIDEKENPVRYEEPIRSSDSDQSDEE